MIGTNDVVMETLASALLGIDEFMAMLERQG